MDMKKFLFTAIALSVAGVLFASTSHAQVPTYTNSGDLSSVTRHSFVTGRVINPKTSADNVHNAALNFMNGYFTTGAQAWHASGIYNFTIPFGFSKLLIVGCGAGGRGETQTGLSSVAATGGGGSGNCYRTVITKEAGSTVTFYVPAPGDTYNAYLNVPTAYNRAIIGVTGETGSLPSWNSGWVDAPGAPGAASQFRGWSQGNGQVTERLAHGAELLIGSANASGYIGGVSKNKIFSADYTSECHPGRGGDGIPVGNGKVPAPAEPGCVMILW